MSRRHTVQEGDCISSIAEQYGLFFNTVWNAPENAELRRLRENPNVLAVGDVVTIPDKRPKEAEGKMTGKRHRFRRKGVPAKLRMRFLVEGKARANEPYELRVGKQVRRGKTDADGTIDEWTAPGADEALLVLGSDGDTSEYRIELGHLQPVDTLKGVQARLAHLGYYKGPVEGDVSEDTIAAVKAFQKDAGFANPDGKLNQQTRDELVRRHEGA